MDKNTPIHRIEYRKPGAVITVQRRFTVGRTLRDCLTACLPDLFRERPGRPEDEA